MGIFLRKGNIKLPLPRQTTIKKTNSLTSTISKAKLVKKQNIQEAPKIISVATKIDENLNDKQLPANFKLLKSVDNINLVTSVHCDADNQNKDNCQQCKFGKIERCSKLSETFTLLKPTPASDDYFNGCANNSEMCDRDRGQLEFDTINRFDLNSKLNETTHDYKNVCAYTEEAIGEGFEEINYTKHLLASKDISALADDIKDVTKAMNCMQSEFRDELNSIKNTVTCIYQFCEMNNESIANDRHEFSYSNKSQRYELYCDKRHRRTIVNEIIEIMLNYFIIIAIFLYYMIFLVINPKFFE